MNLKEYLFYEGITLLEFAKKCDLSAGTICNIVNGKSKPNLTHALAIEEATEGRVTCQNMCAPNQPAPDRRIK